MCFGKKFSLRKKRAVAQTAPRQPAPIPWGQRDFHNFMHPCFDRTDRKIVSSMRARLREERIAAGIAADTYRTPVAI